MPITSRVHAEESTKQVERRMLDTARNLNERGIASTIGKLWSKNGDWDTAALDISGTDMTVHR